MKIKCEQCNEEVIHEAKTIQDMIDCRKQYCTKCAEDRRLISNKKSKKKGFMTKEGRKKKNVDRNKRRWRMFKVAHDFEYEDWIAKRNKTKGICVNCGKDVGLDNLTMDHEPELHEVQRCFIYTLEMMTPLCRPCNTRKYTKNFFTNTRS